MRVLRKTTDQLAFNISVLSQNLAQKWPKFLAKITGFFSVRPVTFQKSRGCENISNIESRWFCYKTGQKTVFSGVCRKQVIQKWPIFVAVFYTKNLVIYVKNFINLWSKNESKMTPKSQKGSIRQVSKSPKISVSSI